MKLSVITINKNNATGLLKTIKSVVEQVFKDFEFIIIDGASADNSVEIIERYREKINYWVSEQDGGIYNAMNKGIVKATGDYCLFLNSGDYLVNNDILTQLFQYECTEDIIAGAVLTYSTKSNEIKLLNPLDSENFSFIDFYEYSLNHQATLIRRNLFYQNGFYDESYSVISDWLFFVNAIVFKAATFRSINLIITKIDSEGISSNLNEIFISEKMPALKGMLPKHILKDYQSGYIQTVMSLKRNKIMWFLFKLLRYSNGKVIKWN
jgi:glycosyltransferase involved in cell wall biosynthesis